MTFFQLMRRNAWRKRLRATLLMFSVGVAFLIYALTASFLGGSQGAAGASDNLLGVFNKSGRGLPLPLAYLNRIARTLMSPPLPILRGCAGSSRSRRIS